MNENVPNGWALYPLNTVLKEVKKKNKSNDNYPVFSVTKYNGFVRSDSYFKKQVFSRDLTTYKVVSEGQFAYATIHLDEGSLGLLKGVEKGLVSPMYTVFETTGSIDNVFLFYLLKSDYFMRLYPSLGQGSIDRRASIPFKVLSGVEFLSPPLSEQKKIAAIFTSVDDVIEKTQAQIDKLKDLKTGMMQELLTRGVGVDGKPHTEFKDSPVGRIPKGWEVRKISELCTHVVDCVNKTAPVVDYKTPYKMIRTTNVRHGRVDTENVRYVTEETYNAWTRRLIPENGDLIFTREAPVGECGVLEDSRGIFLGQRTMMYRADQTKTSSHFLLYSLMSEYGKQQLEDFSGGSTVPHMRVPDCSKILIKLPPKEEQGLIVNSLKSVDVAIKNKEKKLQKVSHMKKALMQDLLTGKVRVKVED